MADVPDRNTADLRAFLADRDLPCPGCGYNLRGLSKGRCPECDQPLELRVGLTEPRLGSYLAALSGVLGGASLAAVFLCTVVMIVILGKGWPRGDEAIVLLLVPGLMALVEGALVLWVLRTRFRVWFRSQRRGGRIRVVLGCWAVTAGFVALFLALLFRWIW